MMGETEIRDELRETRALVRESHSETINSVEASNKILRDFVESSNKETRDFIKWVVGICAVFIIGLCLDHIAVKNKLTSLSNDFGTTLLIAPRDHSEMIQFDILRNKYNPVRGKRETTTPVTPTEPKPQFQ